MTPRSYSKGEFLEGQELVWRRIRPSDYDFQKKQPSSRAFRTDEASVDLGRLTSPEKVRGYAPKVGIAEFKCALVYDYEGKTDNPKCEFDPCPSEEPTNEAHCCFKSKFSKGLCNILVRQAKQILIPEEILSSPPQCDA